MRVTKAIKAQARYSRGLWALLVLLAWQPKSGCGKRWFGAFLLYAAEAHAWQPRDVETLEKMTKSSNTTHCTIPCSCVSSARRTFERDLEYTQWSQRCKFGGSSGQRNGSEKKHVERMNGQVQAKP